ncbi:MAG: acylphosphatase [Halobacteriovoraceae bacterium]|nr:acylphosphatase [Halobacteriovoraceae bacterium]|tara:strand:+ start:6265 stop:6546 length:282 start_codon:yes stop_codon:yes gene_type:complete
MLEMKLYIHGSVQGVGYRYSIIEHIERNQIMVTGYVTNLPNGTVEILAYGDIEALKDLRRSALEGSSRSVVREIEESIHEVTESPYSSFDIKY